ncbi:hypothetical protein NGR_c19860 [Sinorhizobium fredii NGR234]|uniref:Uncharacterized protein n=1 Tax=Sinorhizobium fredii (strain NBRC 101917 / NGR234) TaxID=394 RepID=C3ME80_SINFN|nr:hypothetical protein NGR_c19860 [Sinorhizobium fredii NGR234]
MSVEIPEARTLPPLIHPHRGTKSNADGDTERDVIERNS